jgi:hypothetical protein
LWIALFRIHARTGSSHGWRVRCDSAMIELGLTQVGEIDRVPLPPNLERVVQEVRRQLGGTPLDAAPACNSRGQGCLTDWVRRDQF